MQNPTQINKELDDLFVKKWLIFLAHSEVMGHGSRSPKSADSVTKDTVLCTIMRHETQLGLFTLSIEATVSSDMPLDPHSKTSPAAIIDTFSGNPSTAERPEWLHWPDRVSFVYNRPEFAGLFARIAMWNENLTIKYLSVSMIHWARAIAVGTWAASKQLGPTTPDKSSVPKNFKPHRQRWNDGVYWMRGASSPIPYNCNSDGVDDGEDAEGDSDESMSSDDSHSYYELNLPALCI
ncbi:hypothetical protein B0H11DRAFT_1908551 [Mycena galericulata]|nr:hypothetical protein B0H11DRAFT_1908551 [Mycena galericulata]